MATNLKPYKGSRDFYPKDYQAQNYIFKTWSKVAESYAFERYDSSLVEPLSLYQLKHQTNQEIVDRQIYSFEDRSSRRLALRPEMTPSVARMVAQKRQELSYPLRWYSIPNLWRYERPQRGRLREHWQLNLDIFGVEGVEAEHELLLISRDILASFGAGAGDYTIKISHRGLIELALRKLLVKDDQIRALLSLIDRRPKLETEAYRASYDQLNLEADFEQVEQLLSTVHPDQLPAELKDSPQAAEIKSLFELLEASQISNAQLDLSVVRGFDYYSGIVFEAFDNHSDNNRSLLGGGRYDQLIGSLGVEPLATVGLGMGDVTAADLLTAHNLWPKHKQSNQLYLVIMDGCYQPALAILEQLRSSGLAPIVDTTNRNLSKRITRIAQSSSWLVVIGQAEIASGQFKLKQLADQTSEELALNELIAKIKSHDN